MSDIEHLLENAVVCMENKKDYEDFLQMWQTKDQLSRVNTTADEIWMMAEWVVYTYKYAVTADIPLEGTDEIK